jgi:hypothetical protein
VTGSVDQRGKVQAIGGVNQKIEGFYQVCKIKGLTGSQGVMIPKSNVLHLMLKDEVVQAVDLSHPIILGDDGRVMDGMHRVVRALLEGRATIAAVRFDVDPEPDHRDCDPDTLPYPAGDEVDGTTTPTPDRAE